MNGTIITTTIGFHFEELYMSDNRILYVEANTGISGDMLVAALLDLGAPEERVREVLGMLPVDGFEIRVTLS